MADFKLTYGNMFNPPEELHKGFDKAVAKLRANLGKEYGMIIHGKEVFADDKYDDRSPVNTDWVLAKMQKGNATHAKMAIAAARKAFPAWSRTPWKKRVQLVRKAAVSVEVLDDGIVLAYWYTYTPTGEQMWVIGMGNAQGDKAVLDGLVVLGPQWGEWNPADWQQHEFGTMTLTFQSCDQMTFSYDSDLVYGDVPLGSGSIPMVRLAALDDHKCSEKPLTGLFLAGGVSSGILGLEASIGLAIVGPDGRFFGLFGSGENNTVVVGVIEFLSGTSIQTFASDYSPSGGWVGDRLLTGEYSPGTFTLGDSSGALAFVRDQSGSMSHPALASGTVVAPRKLSRGS